MIDSRFYTVSRPYDLFEIAQITDCEIFPLDTESEYRKMRINAVATLSEAQNGCISFFNNKKYYKEFESTKATACIVPDNLNTGSNNHTILLKTRNPYLAYSKVINLFYSPVKRYNNTISKSASIAKSAVIGQNCYIGHNVVIEDHVVIGNNCVIDAGSFIDFGVSIGHNAKIYSNVSISYAIIGNDAVILSGAKIGQDGFGFASHNGTHHKIQHVGRVIIGNDVEIGANTTIDRGSIGDTIIEDSCRIDNLVQIAHNVCIGRGSVVAAQSGIAGSAKIGQYCALGGQVGIAGHIVVGDRSQIAAQGGVIQNLINDSIVGGTPTVPIRDWHKQSVIIKQLIKNNRKYND